MNELALPTARSWMKPPAITNFPSLSVVEGSRLVGVIERRALLDSVNNYRRRLDQARGAEAVRAAGSQAARPRGIEASQQEAAHTTREQLVRLFSRRQN